MACTWRICMLNTENTAFCQILSDSICWVWSALTHTHTHCQVKSLHQQSHLCGCGSSMVNKQLMSLSCSTHIQPDAVPAEPEGKLSCSWPSWPVQSCGRKERWLKPAFYTFHSLILSRQYSPYTSECILLRGVTWFHWQPTCPCNITDKNPNKIPWI